MNDSEIVTVYSKANCHQCVIAKGKLNLAGVQYTEVSVDCDPAALKKMIDAGHRSVPIFYREGVAVKLDDLLKQVVL